MDNVSIEFKLYIARELVGNGSKSNTEMRYKTIALVLTYLFKDQGICNPPAVWNWTSIKK
jgi:hypothetical protein